MNYINDYNKIEINTFMKQIKDKNKYKKQRNVFIFILFLFLFVQLFYFIFIDTNIEQKRQYQNVILKQDSIMKKHSDYIKFYNNHLCFLFYEINKQLCYVDLMKSEGFKESVYHCPANYKTIGFGHLIKKNDKIPNKINFSYAYDLLVKDFEQAINYAKSIGYIDNNNQQLAIAHAIYCLGIGRVKSIKDFNNDIKKYVYYKDANGINLKSNNLIKNRHFEYELYNK